MRVLVTGSRTWSDVEAVRKHLLCFNSWVPARLVSGACASGADRIAEEIAEELGWVIERHPANWKEYGKSAGFIRNAEMVDLGADVCVAFLDRCWQVKCRSKEPHPSHGAGMTAERAEAAGIRTIRVTRVPELR